MTQPTTSVAQRAINRFDSAHITTAHKLRQAGLNADVLIELIGYCRDIESEDVRVATPEDRRPIPVDTREVVTPRHGCV
jgi:hypothetical protein